MISLQRRGMIGGGALGVIPFLTYTHTWNGSAQVQSNKADLEVSTTDWINVTDDSSKWDLGSGDFTIEAFDVNFESFPSVSGTVDLYRFIGEGSGSTPTGPLKTGWSLYYYHDITELTFAKNDGTFTGWSITWAPSLATDYNIAVVRTGNDLKFYIDGTKTGADGDVTGETFNRQESTGLYIGQFKYASPVATSYMDGLIDALKVSDIARYTGASYTVPSPVNDADTLYLNSFEGANGSTPTLNTGGSSVPDAPSSTLRNTLGLNGSSEYATIAADASITMGDGSRSFACWADIQAASSWFFRFGNYSLGHGFTDFSFGGTSKLQARAFSESGNYSNQRTYVADSTTATGVHHLVVVFNTWGTYDIYVDGSAIAVSATATGAPGTHTGTYTMNLGSYPEASLYLNGALSAPMLFDKNLSAAEVTALYNTGVGIQPADFSGHGNPTIAALYSNMMFGIPFNDGEANEETDGSANTNNATLVGSPVYDGTQQLFEAAPAGLSSYSSFGFDGTGDYISTADSADTNFGTGNFTWCAWVKFDTLKNWNGLMGETVDGNNRSLFFCNSSGQLWFSLVSGGTTLSDENTTSGVASAGVWYHIAMVRDGTAIKIYLDAVSQSMTVGTAISTNSYPDYATTFDFGRSYVGGALRYLDGSMTQPMLFDSALSLSEVEEVYNSGNPLVYSVISTAITDDAVMAFEASSNDSSLTDLSVNSNTGTANGGLTDDGDSIDWQTS